MPRKTYRLIDVTRGVVIGERIERADGFWRRMVGLLGRRTLADDEGLWMVPCNGVHTFGMRFPIDLLVLNRELWVIDLRHGIGPNRIVAPHRGGYSTVELAAGRLHRMGTQIGDRIEIRENG